MEDSGAGNKRKPLSVIDGNARQTRSRTGQGAIKATQPVKAAPRNQDDVRSSRAVVTQAKNTESEHATAPTTTTTNNDAANSWRIEEVQSAGQEIAVVDGGRAEAEAGPFDLDARDRDDELACTEYTDEIYAFLRTDEVRSMVKHDYMAEQTDINAKMRVILTDWLVEVHLKFKLRQETLYLTFQLIDRFLEHNIVARQRLQLVGVTGLMIAAKYEEIYPPEVRDYVYICDNAYTRDQILDMEKLILQRLDFRLSLPTVWSWMKRYVQAAGKRDDAEFFQLVSFVVEVAMIDLLDKKMLQYLPSLLVAAAVHTALQVVREESWTPQLEHHTHYSKADLAGCTADLKALVAHVGTEAKYKAVHKKFAHHKYKEVATLPGLAALA